MLDKIQEILDNAMMCECRRCVADYLEPLYSISSIDEDGGGILAVDSVFYCAESAWAAADLIDALLKDHEQEENLRLVFVDSYHGYGITEWAV